MANNPSDSHLNNEATIEWIIHCINFDETLSYFQKELALDVLMIFPADNPSEALLEGFNVHFRIICDGKEDQSQIRVLQGPNKTVRAPNGTLIEFKCEQTSYTLPKNEPQLVISHQNDSAKWHQGRAGMRYRDLIPARQGGRFIASHILIPEAGPVPDYVHYHQIRFQMIYCLQGWVKVVYEDQGDPFILNAGDSVLQPPQIRHRVLESSADLEVVELGSPAEHLTFADKKMVLPNDEINPDHDFSGQKFVRHQHQESQWEAWRIKGFEMKDFGFSKATQGMAAAARVRQSSSILSEQWVHDEEFLFVFIIHGSFEIDFEGKGKVLLSKGDSCVIDAGRKHQIISCSDDLEFVEVRFSGNFDQVQRTAL